MREYIFPPDNKEEEKIFGAVLTIKQVVFLAAGALIGLVVLIFLYLTLSKFLGIFLGIIFMFSGVPFAFYKKNDLPLHKYLFLKYKHKRKKHKILLIGGNRNDLG